MSTMVLGGASSTVAILENCGAGRAGARAGRVGRQHAVQPQQQAAAAHPLPATSGCLLMAGRSTQPPSAAAEAAAPLPLTLKKIWGMSSSSTHSSTWLWFSRWISNWCRVCGEGRQGCAGRAGGEEEAPAEVAAPGQSATACSMQRDRQHGDRRKPASGPTAPRQPLPCPRTHLVEVAALVAQRRLADEVHLALLHVRLPAVALRRGPKEWVVVGLLALQSTCFLLR